MKQYKVGDTIYIKTTVTEVDSADPALTYRGFDNEWIDTNTIVDELPTAEPVKPVLPKKVGEELDIAKNKFPFDVYIGKVIDGVNSAKASNHYYFDNTNTIIKLADAWRYGYTVEKEPRYKVYVTGTNKQYIYVKRGELAKAHNKKATPITP